MKTTLSRVARLCQPSLSRTVQFRSHSRDSSIQQVATVAKSHESINVQRFRDLAFDRGKPVLMKQQHDEAASVLAIETWFQEISDDHSSSIAGSVSQHLEVFSMIHVPYELMYPQLHEGATEVVNHFISFLESGSNDNTTRAKVDRALAGHLRHQLLALDTEPQGPVEQILLRFDAPLALLFAALRYNAKTEEPNRLRQLYIAQSSLSDLPEELMQDLPTPRVVKEAGRGDLYASSIWLGLEPTYTPLHRDPNPNLFVQLRSSKSIRLLPPSDGDTVFRQVQTRLGRPGGSSRMRGAEMMEGPERRMLHNAIWLKPEIALQEAHLGPGDALFIPKGWWHSVRSSFSDGRLNGSVNWWFR